MDISNLIAALLETCVWLHVDAQDWRQQNPEPRNPSPARGEHRQPSGHWRTLVGCESGFFFRVASSTVGPLLSLHLWLHLLGRLNILLVTLFGSRWQLSRWIRINLPKFWSDSAKPSGWTSVALQRGGTGCTRGRDWEADLLNRSNSKTESFDHTLLAGTTFKHSCRDSLQRPAQGHLEKPVSSTSATSLRPQLLVLIWFTCDVGNFCQSKISLPVPGGRWIHLIRSVHSFPAVQPLCIRARIQWALCRMIIASSCVNKREPAVLQKRLKTLDVKAVWSIQPTRLIMRGHWDKFIDTANTPTDTSDRTTSCVVTERASPWSLPLSMSYITPISC